MPLCHVHNISGVFINVPPPVAQILKPGQSISVHLTVAQLEDQYLTDLVTRKKIFIVSSSEDNVPDWVEGATVQQVQEVANRRVSAGNGLTGGGKLTSDISLAVGAHPDGSILANSNNVQVGVLATDAQHGSRGGGSQHAVATATEAGFMSASDKVKLSSIPASAVPTTRTVTAGDGLTGGGDLGSDVTLNVAANADGSIVVSANDVKVGVLATDAQHGSRGGGSLHAEASSLEAGFMSASDKTKLSGLPSSAVPTSRTVAAGAGLTGGGDLSSNITLDVVANADGSIVVNANDVKVGVLATDAQHGNRGGGSLHAVATALENGFMSASDKTKLSGIATGAAALTSSAPVDVDTATAVVGTASTAAKADHKHKALTAAADAIGQGNSEGTSLSLARADHDHKLKESGGTQLTLGSISNNQILKRSGTAVVGVSAAGVDTSAVHTDVAGEIFGVNQKNNPVNNDWLLIEDSAASNAKKKIKIGNLPGYTGNATKEAFFQPVSNAATQIGFHTGYSVSANATAFMEFFIPVDFSSVTSLEAIVIPQGNNAAADIDLDSNYALVGQAFNQNSESNTSITFTFVANQVTALNISSVFSSLVAGHRCGIRMKSNAVGTSYLMLGIRLKYN